MLGAWRQTGGLNAGSWICQVSTAMSQNVISRDQGPPGQSDTFIHTSVTKVVFSPGPNDFEVREFLCGWGAAFINITTTFPINKVMFRQMLHGMHTKHAVEQLKAEGYRTLYRGLLPPLCQKTVSVSIMFGMYDKYQHILERKWPEMNLQLKKSTAAMFAGWTEAILCPFERVQMLMQDQHFHNRFKNTVHAFEQLRSYGITEYYRGVVPVLIRNGLSNVMFFYMREHIRDMLPRSKSHLGNLVSDFVCGALVGACISTVFYPVNIIKTHMQCQLGGPHPSMYESFRTIYNQRGRSLQRMFYGVHVNYTRALLSWGIINASYEMLRKLLYPTEHFQNSK